MTIITNTINWIKSDWKENKVRCCLEITAWFLSITCSIVMALTIPNPPFVILYPVFITQCMIFGWAAWTRKSTGMVANYSLLVSIDAIAYIRLMTS